MLRFFAGSCPTVGKALLLSTVLMISGCSSPEDRAQSYYQSGMKLFAAHENAKAAIEFRNAVRLKKDLIEAWRALAQIDEASRNWPGLVTDMRAIVDLAPDDASIRLKLGKLLLLAGPSSEALGLVNVGIQIDNRNADLHALKAAISYKLNDQTEARHEAQAALALQPTNADALMVLAIDRLERDDPKAALSLLQEPSLTQAKDLENNVGFQLLKINLLGKTGDLKSAEQALQKLIELKPQEPGYRKLLVNLYVEQHRLDDAEREMRGLAAANPSNSDAALELVRFLYSVKSDPVTARRELNQYISSGEDAFPYQMALADMDQAEGKPKDAQLLLERLIGSETSPEHVRTAKIALAQIYLNDRKFELAEKLATDVLGDEPNKVSALKLRASIHLERAELDAAVADLVHALTYQPRSTELMLQLARAYERGGLIELADKQFADATKISDLDAKIGIEYASFLQRRGSIARSEDILTELNKRRPNNIQVLSTLAQVRLVRQNWKGAQEIAGAIRRIDNSGLADQILGTAFIATNKYDEAIAAFQAAYDAAPTAAQPIDSLVAALLKANRKDQAVAFLKSALTKNPKNANALVLLGSIQIAGGAVDLALKNFQAAIESQPRDSVGYRALADFYIGQKNYDAAIKVLRSGIQQRPDSIPLRSILAGALERKGDYESAISEYESMLESQPSNLILTNNLASLLLDHRKDTVSLKKAQSLAAFLRKSDIPQFKDTFGWARYLQGDYRAAISVSEEAASALPGQPLVRYHLAMGYIATGQLDKASEQLNKALELDPGNELKEEIRSALRKTGT